VYFRQNVTFLDLGVHLKWAGAIGVARGCTGCMCIPRAENKLGPNLQAKVVSAPPGRECTRRQSKSPFFEEIGEIWTVGEVSFSVCFEGDD